MRVTLVEPMGADTLVFCVTDEDQEITVRLPRYTAVREGRRSRSAPARAPSTCSTRRPGTD